MNAQFGAKSPILMPANITTYMVYIEGTNFCREVRKQGRDGNTKRLPTTEAQ